MAPVLTEAFAEEGLPFLVSLLDWWEQIVYY